jgi:hypothetical protein
MPTERSPDFGKQAAERRSSRRNGDAQMLCHVADGGE